MKKRSIAGIAMLLAASPGVTTSAEPGCDRACLADVLDTYLTALVRHDPAALPSTRNLKYTENGVRLQPGDGLWQTAAARPVYRLDAIDEEAGQVGLLGRISENGNLNWYGVRLKVEPDRRVSEIEVLVNRSAGGGAGPGPTSRAHAEVHPLMAEPVPAARRHTRADLVRLSDAYFTGLDTTDSSAGVSFSPQCQRRENGMVMANDPAATSDMQRLGCKDQFDTGFSVIVTDIRERRFEVVDRTTGIAFAWAYFDHDGTHRRFSRTLDRAPADVPQGFQQPSSFYIAEMFKVVDGQIRQIEAVLTSVPYGMESGW